MSEEKELFIWCVIKIVVFGFVYRRKFPGFFSNPTCQLPTVSSDFRQTRQKSLSYVLHTNEGIPILASESGKTHFLDRLSAAYK